MKKLFLIGGAMGVGKTAVCRQLNRDMPNSVFLDGDWCWNADPFQVTRETKAMVLDNICYVLNNFLHCTAYDTVIFCWVMDRREILDAILDALDRADCGTRCISLLANAADLTARITKDVSQGLRAPEDVERSLSRLPLYEALDTIKIDTTGKSIQAVCREIEELP